MEEIDIEMKKKRIKSVKKLKYQFFVWYKN